jgi:hypothetical protein
VSKATLYIDVDDTIICDVYPGSPMFDLRPGVMTQLRVLTRLFQCRWLTVWPQERIVMFMRLLYGAKMNKDLLYQDWGKGHESRKAGAVLAPEAPSNWWWLENPLTKAEYAALEEAGKLDRYIEVEPLGQWGFLDGVNELFRRAGITDQDIKRVQGNPDWFKRP